MKTTLLMAATVATLGLATGAHAMGERPTETATHVITTATQTQAEVTHRMETLQAGMLALETSKLAVSKANSPIVRQFAVMEVEEQTTLASIFKGMYPNAAEVGLNTDNVATLNKLKETSSKGFDAAYVEAQIEGHKKLLEIQDDYISAAKNREELNVAKLARGQIKEHIMLLEAYQRNPK